MQKARVDEPIQDTEPLSPKALTKEEYDLYLRRQREEEFADGMQEHRERFLRAVSDSKPYVDFVALLAILAVVGALFATGINGLAEGHRWPERYVAIIAIAIYLGVRMFPHLVATNDAIAAMSFIKLAKLFRLPYPFKSARSTALRVIFETYIGIAGFLMGLGTAAVGYEVAQRTISTIEQAAPKADKTKAPTFKASSPKVEPPPLPD